MAENETDKKPVDPRVKVDGKTFIFTTEDGDVLTLPLRIKTKTLRALNDVLLDVEGKFKTVEAIAPDQVDIVDEMDANDFSQAFDAWRDAYADRAGASLGESSSSSS